MFLERGGEDPVVQILGDPKETVRRRLFAEPSPPSLQSYLSPAETGCDVGGGPYVQLLITAPMGSKHSLMVIGKQFHYRGYCV